MCTDRVDPGVDSDVCCVGWSDLRRHPRHYTSTLVRHHTGTTTWQRLLRCRIHLLHHSTSSLWGTYVVVVVVVIVAVVVVVVVVVLVVVVVVVVVFVLVVVVVVVYVYVCRYCWWIKRTTFKSSCTSQSLVLYSSLSLLSCWCRLALVQATSVSNSLIS